MEFDRVWSLPELIPQEAARSTPRLLVFLIGA
jgi:hypothetical protein